MIYRLTQKLAKKIKESPDQVYPQHGNALLDWSGHLFRANRKQYVILTNTVSLYSMVFSGKLIRNYKDFILESNARIEAFLTEDGFGDAFEELMEPNMSLALFSKSLNRSVLGYINDFVYRAEFHIVDDRRPLLEISLLLNQTPLPGKEYFNPREGFIKLVEAERNKND